jgi:DNA-directed RNA polymerase I, II, and III subunit RPABC1
MLDTRGYSPQPLTEIDQQINIMKCQSLKKQHDIVVVFLIDESIGMKTIEFVDATMNSMNCSHYIVIYPMVLTSLAKKTMDKFKHRIEYFSHDELKINLMGHELMPKVIVLTTEEKNDLLHSVRITESQLPKIQSTDPMARYFGLTKGDVIRVIRKSETAGLTTVFRVCV